MPAAVADGLKLLTPFLHHRHRQTSPPGKRPPQGCSPVHRRWKDGRLWGGLAEIIAWVGHASGPATARTDWPRGGILSEGAEASARRLHLPLSSRCPAGGMYLAPIPLRWAPHPPAPPPRVTPSARDWILLRNLLIRLAFPRPTPFFSSGCLVLVVRFFGGGSYASFAVFFFEFFWVFSRFFAVGGLGRRVRWLVFLLERFAGMIGFEAIGVSVGTILWDDWFWDFFCFLLDFFLQSPLFLFVMWLSDERLGMMVWVLVKGAFNILEQPWASVLEGLKSWREI